MLLYLMLFTLIVQTSSINNQNYQPNSAYLDRELFLEQLDKHLKDDFEISQYFSAIKLLKKASKHKYVDSYSIINNLYFQALQNLNLNIDSTYIKEEIEYISIIADEETVSRLKIMVDKMNPEVGHKIGLFWNQLNPNPLSLYNIRLFEHWERINFAKANFTRRENSIINTDDRGTVYVKFGHPSNHYSGLLPFNNQRVRGWMREYDILNTERSYSRERDNIFLSNLVSQFYKTTFYDVWIYKNITERDLIFIFGNEGNTGRFEMVKTLEELIPSNSFRAREEFKRFNIGPSFFLQLMMYDHFSIYDPYFSSTFNELESQFLSTVNIMSPEYSKSRSRIHRSEITRAHNEAPEHFSEYLTGLYELGIEQDSYLTFSKEGHGIYYSFMHIDTDKLTYDENIYPIRVSIFNQNDFLNQAFYDTVFNEIPNENILLSFKKDISADLAVNSYSEGYSLQAFFNHTQISHNKISTQSNDYQNNIWVGDLILGKRKIESKTSYNNNLVPFDIIAENQFQKSDILTFYLGVKNTNQNYERFEYEADISIEKRDRRFLFIPLRNKTSFSYTVTSDTRDAIDEQIVEIDLSGLEAGNYKLIIKVTNREPLNTVKRTSDFIIN